MPLFFYLCYNEIMLEVDIRTEKEQYEKERLSEYAQLSSLSKGRDKYEEPDRIRTCYERDRDRVIHCKSFRRLKHKTQVFIAPDSDHYRTRLTHTLEVSQIARTISKALKLNEDLTEAIALAHDMGHTPFGHTGEKVLNELTGGFEHNIQSLRVVDRLEKNGQGLNLTWEVRDGIKNHSFGLVPATLEGKVVNISDKLAYINHDIDDAERAGILTIDDFPKDIINVLGNTKSESINTMILDIVENSYGKPDIIKSPAVDSATLQLRDFLFEKVYINSIAKKEEPKAQYIVRELFKYYNAHPEEMPDDYVKRIDEDGLVTSVCDYIAGMTDNYAVNTFKKLFVPSVWSM